jgi:pyruvate-ferredoxin/flavodoxin oxidoreductase
LLYVCPDTAIPGLVSDLSDVLNTVVNAAKNHGKVEYLPKAVRQMEGTVRALFKETENGATVNSLIQDAIDMAVEASDNGQRLCKELGWFREELGDFKFALTRPYFDLHEKIRAE